MSIWTLWIVSLPLCFFRRFFALFSLFFVFLPSFVFLSSLNVSLCEQSMGECKCFETSQAEQKDDLEVTFSLALLDHRNLLEQVCETRTIKKLSFFHFLPHFLSPSPSLVETNGMTRNKKTTTTNNNRTHPTETIYETKMGSSKRKEKKRVFKCFPKWRGHDCL